MRTDSVQFASLNEAETREPRFVVRIEFDTASPHITSHADIPGVPGLPLLGILQRPSAISQKIVPDEGRSEIGSFSFSLVDKNAAFTDAMRAQLFDQSAGLRRRKVQFYVGYKGMNFADFQLFQTQTVLRCTYREGCYQITCSDITRALRKEIFRPVTTTLRESASETATEILVYSTEPFDMILHGTAYSDAPNSTVGYIRIEDEIIRYTSKSANQFNGCTRGALNTKAVAHSVDGSTTASRRTQVEEFIYLEGPGPKLAYAVLTGLIHNTASVLPEHWNLGVDPSLVRLTDFTNIGTDLWNPADDSATLVLRFDGLKQQDGKRFIESEMFLLLGCFSPVYSDGTIGLRRITGIISDAAPVVTLTERELVQLSSLEHEYTLLHNDFRIYWAYNNILESFVRTTGIRDEYSIETHGASDVLPYEFRGLHSARATDSTIAQRLDSIRDRYTEPPQTLTATVLGTLNRLEVGDIVRVRVPDQVLRDFAGPPGNYNRSFEVQQKTYDAYSGDVTLSLFGSSARPLSSPSTPDSSSIPLPDSWYTSQGTSLATVAPITANTMATGTYTITGSAGLNNLASIFYWNGDLTIPSGCTLNLVGNVQLRIKGYLTHNGVINGNGGGKAGVADNHDLPWDTTYPGDPGFVGGSRGWDGITNKGRYPRTPHLNAATLPVPVTAGRNPVFPVLSLSVVGGSLIGLPSDLRGTGGGAGGRVVANPGSITAYGETGGAGGAGLAIICRGMSFGLASTVTLNGTSTTSGSQVFIDGIGMYAGAGGPGGPGALLILLDGNFLSIPVIATGNVVATTGGMTQAGNPMPARESILHAYAFNSIIDQINRGAPHSGYADPGLQGAWSFSPSSISTTVAPYDMSNACLWIQHVPTPLDAEDDVDTRPPPPTFLRAGPGNGGNILVWFNPDLSTFDVIEVWASLDNNRTNALKVGETRSTDFTHRLPLGGRYYYWIRAKLNPISGRPAVYSEWERVSSTDGESSNTETPGEIPEAPDDFTAVGKLNGIQFNWSLPWAKLSGLIRLYEGASGSDIEDATMVWEGYAFGYFLSKADTTIRDYWMVLGKGGVESVPEPNGAGLPAAASSVTSALTVTCFPDSVSRSASLGTNPRFVITPPTTATISGGTGPYSILWTFHSGGTGITIDTPTFDDTTFSGSHNLDGTTLFGTARCTVTDATSATAFDDVEVQLHWPSTA